MSGDVQSMVQRYLERKNLHAQNGAGRIYPLDPAAVAQFKSIVKGDDMNQERKLTGVELWAAYRDLYIGEKRTLMAVAESVGTTPGALQAAWEKADYGLDRRHPSAYRARKQLKAQAESGHKGELQETEPVGDVAEPPLEHHVQGFVNGHGLPAATPERQLQAVMQQLQQMLAMENVTVSGRVQLDLRVEVDLGGKSGQRA